MSALWRFILDSKTPGLTFDQVKEIATRAGYHMLSFEGKIYGAMDGADFKELPGDPAMLNEPQVFCVMDKDEKKVLMLEQGMPFLCIDPAQAKTAATTTGGVVKTLGEGLYLLEKAKNASPIIVPEAPAIIPARG